MQFGDSREEIAQIQADESSQGGVKPAGTVYLGEGVYTITLRAGETATIRHIPAHTSYKVWEAEDGKDGYKLESITDSDAGVLVKGEDVAVTVTNAYHNPKTTALTVVKVWQGTDADKHLPDSVTVQLYQGETALGDPIDLTAEGGWSHTWSGLQQYDSEGNAYAYSVKEVKVTYGENAYEPENGVILVGSTASGFWNVGGGGSVAEQDEAVITVTNTWNDIQNYGDLSFSIHKVDSDDSTVSIENVKFELKKGSQILSTQTTDKDGRVTFGRLSAGVYTLTEIEVPDAYKANGNIGRTWTVTLTDTSVEVKDEAGKVLDVQDTAVTIENTIIKGRLSITKDLTGAESAQEFIFSIYKGTDTAVAPIAELKVKAGEAAETEELPYGVYTIVETNTDLPGYKWTGVTFTGAEDADTAEGFQVNVSEQDKTYTVTAVNSYTQGGLSITKRLSGNDTQADRDWHFTVTLTAPVGVTLGRQTISFTGSGADSARYVVNGSTYTITMKGGVTAEFGKTLPVGATYTVTEQEANQDGYSTAVTKNGSAFTLEVTGTVEDGDGDAIVFTNSRSYTPDEPDEPDDPTPETPPEEEIPDNPPPLDDFDVPDDEVPLVNLPGEEVILEEEIPLAEVPLTGDSTRSGFWMLTALASGLAALWLALTRRKNKEDSADNA